MSTQTVTAEQTPNPQQEAQELSPEDASQRMVPVTEAIRYRKRAQVAEGELADVRQSFTELQSQLTEAQEAVSQLERRQTIDALLSDSDVVDMQVARLLTEAAVTSMDEPDVQLAIEDLRRTKPYLFRQHQGAGASAMSAHANEHPHQAARAAQRAAESGDRRDLLRYLRLRRKS